MKLLTDTDRERLRHLRRLGVELCHFFDVGASNGRWSSRVSQDFPNASFELFEPLIDHAPEYRFKMEATLARHPRFRLHKVALGPKCKSTRMTFYLGNVVGSTALELGHVPEGSRTVPVEMLTLDYVVQEFRLPVPQVIKMDTQGCELGILQGAVQTLPQVQLLLLECWLTRAYGPTTPLLLEVTDWLRNFDFHLWDVGNTWREADGTLVTQDCYFLNARCPVSRLRDEPSRLAPKPAPVPAPPRQPKQEVWFKRMRHFVCGGY